MWLLVIFTACVAGHALSSIGERMVVQIVIEGLYLPVVQFMLGLTSRETQFHSKRWNWPPSERRTRPPLGRRPNPSCLLHRACARLDCSPRSA